MNKTININLAGIIFHLDEVSYEKFKTYLSNVRTALGKEESGEEKVREESLFLFVVHVDGSDRVWNVDSFLVVLLLHSLCYL